jgi:hypothetical protein
MIRAIVIRSLEMHEKQQAKKKSITHNNAIKWFQVSQRTENGYTDIRFFDGPMSTWYVAQKCTAALFILCDEKKYYKK